MLKHNVSIYTRSLFIVLVIALSMTALNPAFAKSPTDLVDTLPSDTEIVMGIDMSTFSDTLIFREALLALRKMPDFQNALTMVEGDMNIDITKDIKSVVFGSPQPNVGAGNYATADYTVVIAGDFSSNQLKSHFQKKFPELTVKKEGKLEILSASDIDVAFPAEGIMIATQGNSDYRVSAWKSIADNKPTLSTKAMMQRLLSEGAILSHQVWIVAEAGSIPQESGPNAQGAGIFMDFKSGMDLELMSIMNTATDAQAVMTQLNQLKQIGSAHPMVGVLGLSPLVDKFDISQHDTTVRATTSITGPQLRTIMNRLKPLLLDAPPVQNSPSPQSAPDAQPKQQPAERKPRTTGAPADFN